MSSAPPPEAVPLDSDTANASPPPKDSFRLSSLIISVYGPTIMFAIGQGAVMPIVPLYAKELKATDAEAALLVGLLGIGQIVVAVPAGLIVSRWGDKVAMIGGTTVIWIVGIGASFSPSLIVFAVFTFLLGVGWGIWTLARLVYVSESAPTHMRGRALSMLGGMGRIGNFIGPLIGGYLGQYVGLYSAFLAQAGFCVVASIIMFIFVTPHQPSEKKPGTGLCTSLCQTVRAEYGVLLRLTFPIFALGMLRQARQVFLPLWGDDMKLTVTEIGILTAVSFGIDAAIFLPSGWVMDNLGRNFAAIPCLGGLSLGLAALPFTWDFWSVLAVAVLTGIGNGFGAGINMTWGADFAPPDRKGEFLGLWRLLGDTGTAVGPFLIGFVTAVATLSLSSLVCAGLGALSVLMVIAFVPETLPVERRRCRRHAGYDSMKE